MCFILWLLFGLAIKTSKNEHITEGVRGLPSLQDFFVLILLLAALTIPLGRLQCFTSISLWFVGVVNINYI